MSAEVKILIEGTTNADSVEKSGEEKTRPTITLIREGDLTMVVDPGVLESQQVLIDALAEEGLSIDDVNFVCITHSHIDHYRNIGMFPNAKTLEFFGLWSRETVDDWPEQFSPHIQVLKTPGHDYTGITLLVTTEDGVVAICGDVFWKENFPEDVGEDLYATDFDKLKKSRELILKRADWIIPGHAGMFKAKKNKDNFEENRNNKTKNLGFCKKCKKAFRSLEDSCICRPWLCYRCCECELDCNFCSCSHKNR